MPRRVRLNDRKGLRIEAIRARSGVADETAALLRRNVWSSSPMKPAKRITCCIISTKEEIEFLRDHKDVAPAKRRRITSRWPLPNATSGSHPRADESAGALGRSPRRHLARHRAGHHRRARLDHAPHTLEEKAKTYPASPRA